MPRKIKALCLDCDDTLVQSEKYAFIGCARLSNEVLKSKGVDKQYTPDQLRTDFVGQNFRKLLQSLAARHNFTLSDQDLDAMVDRELRELIEELSQHVEPCEGANEALDKLAESKKYVLSVVSSSALPRVQACLRKTGQDAFFASRVYSAATSLDPPTTKPDPAIYLHACRQLGFDPSECVAVEDSKSGATAAKRAGMPLIGYVGCCQDEEEREALIKVLRQDCDALEIMYHWSEIQDCLDRIEGQ